MTQNAKTIGRRELLQHGATIAAVAAIPVVGLSLGPTKAQPAQDKHVELVNRYWAEIAAMNAKHDDLTEEEIEAAHDKIDGMFSSAADMPVLTAASAIAILDLVVKEEDIGEHNIFGEHFKGLIDAVRGYIASTAEVRS